MVKHYPISAYIVCIKKLGIPYPVLGLKGFLSGYTANFTRQTDPDNILFDGISDVIIKKVPNSHMSSQHIHSMLMGLIVNHALKAKIVTHYKFASTQLSKREDPKILNIYKNFNLKNVSKPSTPPPTPFISKKSLDEDQKEKLKYLVESVNENIKVTDNTENVPQVKEEDVLAIISSSDYSLSSILDDSTGKEFIEDVWLNYHGHIVLIELSSWPFILAPENSSGEGEGINSIKLLKDIVDKFSKIRKVKIANIISPPLIPKFKKDLILSITKAKKEALVATPESPQIKNNVRGMFHSLLPTHNTSLDTALNMFLGNFQYIKGVEKTGEHVYPVGRGAQFRWGIDSQYGEVIFIMKPQFWRNYSKGVEESFGAPKITDEVIFNDFWAGKQRNELEAEEQMKLEASYFGFREPHVVDVEYCKNIKDRKNLTWCNIQIHIGENVSLDDVETVLFPRYLGSVHNNPKFENQLVSDILFKTQFSEMIERDGVHHHNPFYQKIVEYGPLLVNPKPGDIHPHYSVVLKAHRKERHNIYDSILKGYKVSDMAGDDLEKVAVKNALHRARWGGHSSSIGLSKLAYIDAEEEYMYKLLEHNLA